MELAREISFKVLSRRKMCLFTGARGVVIACHGGVAMMGADGSGGRCRLGKRLFERLLTDVRIGRRVPAVIGTLSGLVAVASEQCRACRLGHRGQTRCPSTVTTTAFSDRTALAWLLLVLVPHLRAAPPQSKSTRKSSLKTNESQP